jgi:hypothetical protein
MKSEKKENMIQGEMIRYDVKRETDTKGESDVNGADSKIETNDLRKEAEGQRKLWTRR